MKVIVFILLTLSVLVSCKTTDSHDQNIDMRKLQEAMIDQNKKIHQNQKVAIRKHIESNNWGMVETDTGLWYEVLEEGASEAQINPGDEVEIWYSSFLLDGSLVSDEHLLKPRKVKVGYSQMETGLHQGLQFLRRGDSARLVLPSHLAHGFTGDLEKIPFDAAMLMYLRIDN